MQARLVIGLPVYNGAGFLEHTVRTLLSQTYPDFRLIIGDNASTDSTREIADRLCSEDPRVQYVRNEHNLGLAGNYNALFRRAEAEFFKWAPVDDFYHPTYLERCISALDADPEAVLAYPRTQFVNEKGELLDIFDPGWDLRSEEPTDRLRYTLMADHWVNSIIGVIRRPALARTRLHPRYPGGDYVLLGELSLIGKFIEVPEKLFYRRLHPEASSQMQGNLGRLVPWLAGPRGGLPWPTWQRTIGHLTTITGSSLDCGSRLRLLTEIARAVVYRRQRLGRELFAVGRLGVRRLFGRPA